MFPVLFYFSPVVEVKATLFSFLLLISQPSPTWIRHSFEAALSWVFLSYILPYLSVTFNTVDLSLFWKHSLSLVSRAPHLVVNGSSLKLMISPLNLILC